MKKILFAMTATAIVLCATSCSDYFLDLTPTDQQTEANYYKSAKEFEVAAKSTYSFYGFKDMSETVNGTKYTRTFYDIMDNNSDIISGVHSIAAGTQAGSSGKGDDAGLYRFPQPFYGLRQPHNGSGPGRGGQF